jgi:hypothetical protein
MGHTPMAGAEADTARAEPDGMKPHEVKSAYESGTPHPSRVGGCQHYAWVNYYCNRIDPP